MHKLVLERRHSFRIAMWRQNSFRFPVDRAKFIRTFRNLCDCTRCTLLRALRVDGPCFAISSEWLMHASIHTSMHAYIRLNREFATSTRHSHACTTMPGPCRQLAPIGYNKILKLRLCFRGSPKNLVSRHNPVRVHVHNLGFA